LTGTAVDAAIDPVLAASPEQRPEEWRGCDGERGVDFGRH
jgi:hypothetical protein